MIHYRCALITGASSGLGEEFVSQLAPHCDSLILVARREERLEEISSRLHQSFPELNVYTVPLDLTDAKAREKFIAKLAAKELRPDLLINNAGMGDYGEFQNSEWSKTERMIELNVTALTHLAHAFLPSMLAENKGGILNVSSLASCLPIPDFAVYAATKAYVSSFSEALRLELKHTKISVTALCPGPVHTEFGDVAKRGETGKDFSVRELAYVDKEQVVSDALAGLQRNAPRVYPGLIVAGAALALSVLPLVAVRLIMGQRPRRQK